MKQIRDDLPGFKFVTFVGYSGQGYEDVEAMKEKARKELSQLNKLKWIVNIGVTPDGIGAVYEVANEMGFRTIGIASTEYKKYPGPSPYVDRIYLVEDSTWGGRSGPAAPLNPTSVAMVGISDRMVGIGGGDVGYYELKEGIDRKMDVRLYSARTKAGTYKKAGKEHLPSAQELIEANPDYRID
jgi:hypothetical protein